MKKFTAVLVAVVLVLTCLLAVACNVTAKVYMHDYDENGTKVEVYDGTLPTPPAREGYVFGGWYTDASCTKEFVDGTMMVASFHVYAKWTPIGDDGDGNQTVKVTVIFNPNYEGATTTTQQVNKGSTVALPTISRGGYNFDGWWTAPTGGTQWKSTDKVNVDGVLTLYAHWTLQGSTSHTHDFGANNYFMFVKCSGCDVYGRTEGDMSFREDFVLDFDESYVDYVDGLLDDLLDAIDGKNNLTGSQFCDLFLEFSDALTYLQFQFFVASTLDDVEYTDESYETYADIGAYYYEMYAWYCTLFGEIDESAYASYFWDWTGWSDEEIASAIDMGNYSSESQSELNDILDEYDEAYEYYFYGEIDADEYYEWLNELFGEFVKVNNKIAQENNVGAGKNYMDYSYANDYNRNYSPADVATMRNYVKTYMGDIFAQLADAFDELYYEYRNGKSFKDADYDFFDAFEFFPMFFLTFEEYTDIWEFDSEEEARAYWEDEYSEEAMQLATNFVGEYFKWLDNSNKCDFFGAVNDVFKKGNYFDGLNDGAYTAMVPHLNTPIMYFGGVISESEYYYQSATTFVHEFGHYYEFLRNGDLSISYDHDETQSQGNEMLFLAWLAQNNNGASNGYELMRLYELLNIVQSIIQSTAVDELEWVVYSGADKYNNKNIPTDINGSVDYTALYEMILETYVDSDVVEEWMDTTYWEVAFDSPCYYISYAMSGLVSLELYMQASSNLNTGRDTYLKLFTFADEAQFVATVTDGDDTYSYLKADATYAKILTWCGLRDAFNETLYTDLQTYFGNN